MYNADIRIKHNIYTYIIYKPFQKYIPYSYDAKFAATGQSFAMREHVLCCVIIPYAVVEAQV